MTANAKKGSIITQVQMTNQMYRELKKEAASYGMSYSAYIKHLIIIAKQHSNAA